jgi:hypothetical protein
MRRGVPISTIATCILIAACGARTQLGGSYPVDGSDASADAIAADISADGASGCHPIPNPCATQGDSCSDEGCQAWAQGLTASGYAHSGLQGPQGSQTCGGGADCKYDSVTGGTVCYCGKGFGCHPHEVCVSDTLDGPATCRSMCVPVCPVGCTATPCLCQTSPVPGDVCWASGRVCAEVAQPASCQLACPDAN